MCISPDMPDEPEKKQTAKSPDGGVARSAATSVKPGASGRRGTVLTGGSGLTEAATVGKKRLFGL